MKKCRASLPRDLLVTSTILVSFSSSFSQALARTNDIYQSRALSWLLSLQTGQDRALEFGSPTAAAGTPGLSSNINDLNEKSNNSTDTLPDSNPDTEQNLITEPQTIVVTGSHIRGVNTAVGNQLLVIDQQEIERSGFSNIGDLVRSLPQNFSGGATGELTISGGNNIGYGVSMDLRGLGPIGTLVLINGRRLPSGGLSASTVDISGIPLAAIERVEILPDGASAVYGSDAVAGVVNYIFRRDYEGFETNARYGTTTKGSLDEIQFSQVAGASWDWGNILAAYEYYERDNLPRTDRPYAATLDLSRFGGKDHRTPHNNPANIIDPLTSQIIYAVPPGQNGENLTVGRLLPASSGILADVKPHYQDLLPEQRRHSLYSLANIEFTDYISSFIEARYFHRKVHNRLGNEVAILRIPSTNPYWIDIDGTGQPNSVAYSFHRDIDERSDTAKTKFSSITGGITLEIAREWHADGYISYSQERINRLRKNKLDSLRLFEVLSRTNTSETLNPFGDGSYTNPDVINYIFGKNEELATRAIIKQASIIANGPLISIFGNSIRAAVGVDLRYDRFRRIITEEISSMSKMRRNVQAFFTEFFVPFAAPDNNIKWFHELHLSASVRHERYSDRGIVPKQAERPTESTTDPRFGIRWAPVPEIVLRGSYGTSFRSPSLTEVLEPLTVMATPYPDMVAPTGTAPVLALYGTNPNVSPETATTWTLGLDVDISKYNLPRVSVSYFDIKFKDRLAQPEITDLSDPQWSEFIVRNPTSGQLEAACTIATPGQLFATPEECMNPELIHAIVDLTTRNFSETLVQGVDLFINQSIQMRRYGNLILGLNATHFFTHERVSSAGAAAVKTMNRPLQPVDFRARASVNWSPNTSLSINIYLNYIDNYSDELNNNDVESWTTTDLNISYQTHGDLRAIGLNDTTFSLNVRNLFANNPPFVDLGALTLSGYDPANAEALGRIISINIKKLW